MVILGKTNLSEWANFRSFFSVSGWSAVGGQTHNPYGLDRNPCGSSSGSGAAVSANFAAVSIGTETDGSIVCPANANGVVGIKPTVGLTSRAGVVPISHTQDTIGPHGRTVADAAALLGVMQSRTYDGRDAATGGVPLGWQGRFTRPTNIPSDYTQFLNPNGLVGARLGVTRQGIDNAPAQVVAAFETVIAALKAAGATVIQLDGPNADVSPAFTFPPANGELFVLEYDFKGDAQSYFATRVGVPVAGGSLADAIAFDNANAAAEMPFWGQELFTESQALLDGADTPQTDPNLGVPVGTTYNQALAMDQSAVVNGIDLAISTYQLDAVVAPTDNPAWSTDLLYGDHFVFGSSGLGAPGGYPYVQVPAANVYGIPFGLTFFGTAFSEPKLITLASGFEAATQERAHNLPQLTPTIPDDHIQGVPLNVKHGGKKPAGWHPHHM
jgi:amidase